MHTAAAARLLHMHPKELATRAKLGKIPFTWTEGPYGRLQRNFDEADVLAYAERRRQALIARLAVLSGENAA